MSDSKVINLDAHRRRTGQADAPPAQSALMTDGVVDLPKNAMQDQGGKAQARIYVLDPLRPRDADGPTHPGPLGRN